MASHESQSSRLVLGTAQLGMHYGIANKTGQPDMLAVKSMITGAWEGGVREFDTGQAYGESESVLGKALNALGITREARVISKFDPTVDHHDSTAMRRSVETGEDSVASASHRPPSPCCWEPAFHRALTSA